MKRIVFALLTPAFFSFNIQDAGAQDKKDKLNMGTTSGQTSSSSSSSANKGNGLINNVISTVTGNGSTGTLSNSDIVGGLREALTVGARNASSRLNTTNGFFGNALIKILMPPELKQAETTLRSWGFGAQVDRLILSMNRSAEDAAGQAVPVFVNAITSMSIQDGLSILKGGNGAATSYLRSRTTAALTTAFRPVIEKSLGKVGTTKLWSEVFTTYNKIPIVRNKINPDLTGYVTERALNGLFVSIADEENKIRNNPAARVTDLLQKVFGNNG